MTLSFVSPPRYVQSSGALSLLGVQADRLGRRVLLVADDVVHGIVDEAVEQSFSSAESEYHVATFGGECTEDEVVRLAEHARRVQADVVVGAGGGKTIDVAKSVRAHVGGCLISLPTVASTDAPTSGLSVTYDEAGKVVGGIVHNRHPDLVLVDTEVIAAAPTRWFVSGIGDALATQFEAAATVESGGRTVAGGPPTQAGLALAERCYEVLRGHALDATRAVRAGTVTEAVELATEAIVLLSGLGFENGGLAAAHAIHDGVASTVETTATHGEKVCFGLLTQLVLEGRPEEEIRDVAAFARDVGLPVTLAGIDVVVSDVDDIARATCSGESTITNQPGEPTPTDVRDAILAADELGHSLE